jgi:hypothetical protein
VGDLTRHFYWAWGECRSRGCNHGRGSPERLVAQAELVAFEVGHHAPAESILLEILQRESPTTQSFDLSGRLLDMALVPCDVRLSQAILLDDPTV